MRIFPLMWASTLWPFSSSTRNMALGSGSTTVPSTRIVSSFGLARAIHLLRSGAQLARKSFHEPTDHAIWSGGANTIGHSPQLAPRLRHQSAYHRGLVTQPRSFWASTRGG